MLRRYCFAAGLHLYRALCLRRCPAAALRYYPANRAVCRCYYPAEALRYYLADLAVLTAGFEVKSALVCRRCQVQATRVPRHPMEKWAQDACECYLEYAIRRSWLFQPSWWLLLLRSRQRVERTKSKE